ncbi:MAG: hypothetical protein GY762_12755 [Proteobacteria bacterium]|nr:hypothetical protein [Pseudomonadota bacterium]
MKTIIIAGGGRKAGKTTLSRELGALLPDSRVVKLGHHPAKKGKPTLYFQTDTPYRDLKKAVGQCRFLIIESGAILDDPELAKDLVIFLPAREGPDKPGAERRHAAADLVRGETVREEDRDALQERLGVDATVFHAILEAVGVPDQ